VTSAPAAVGTVQGPRPLSAAVPLVLFFVSGACALVYQVVWVRRLLLITGTTTAAVSTVLAVFMAGLGLGAWIFGRRADRSADPLKMYGYLELGIALYALALPWLIHTSTPLYLDLARDLAGWPAALLLLRVVFGFLLLLAPTVLLGGTLPVLVRYVGRNPERFGRDLGVLYTANLAGGVAGSLAAGFVLIRWLGVEGATMTAVLANVAVGVAAVWLADRRKSDAMPTPARASATAVRLSIAEGARPLVWAAVVLSGVWTMAYEVLWTRILVFPFQSTIYAFTLILATFLAGLALGSRLFAAVERRPHPLRALSLAQALAGLTALSFTPLATGLLPLMHGATRRLGTGGDTYLAITAGAAALVMLVPATFMGMVLPLGMCLLVDDLARSGRRVGAVYFWNTVGSVAGSLAAGFLLIPWLGLKGALLALALVQVAVGLCFLPHLELPAPRRRQVLIGVGVLVSGAAWLASWSLRGPSPFERQNLGPNAYVLAHRDAVGATVTVVSDPRYGNVLHIDGFLAAAGGLAAAYMPMMTHIPMLVHPDPQRLLVICFGTGSTAGAGLLHPGTRIDVVDINPAVFDFAGYFAAWNHGVAGDPRARRIVDDGRNFLLTTTERYDVITSEPMPPHFAGVVNLYSREYYRLAYERLRPGGLMVQWLPFHLMDAGKALAILRTVQEVFPETTLWLHDYTGIVVARRDAPVTLDLRRVGRALEPGALATDLARFGVRTPRDFAGLFAVGPQVIAQATARTAPITDDRPSLEFQPPPPPVAEVRRLPGVNISFDRQTSRSIDVFHRLKLESTVPLAQATAGEEAAVARAHQGHAHEVLGRFYAVWGYPAAALPELEAAAGVSDDTRTRAALLAEAASAAERSGRREDARRLLRDSLAAVPDQPDVVAREAALAAAPGRAPPP
jgi:spermidine synthase